MMLKSDLSNFKTHKMCGMVVKRLSYAFSYVSDQYKTQQMRESVVLKNPENLQLVPNHFKTQEMCERAN